MSDTPVETQENKEEVVIASQGMVLYSDGGCRPNPGYGGWGVHGYLYTPEVPKKASGHPDHVCTSTGYVSKLESALKLGLEGKQDRRRYDRNIEVTPIHYVDGYGSLLGSVSNNVAELEAAIQAMRHALEYDITEFQLWTDSSYVCNGLQSWAVTWQANGWIKQDLTEVANVTYWKALLEVRDRLVQRGVSIKVEWIKGHSELLGNVMADKLATLGVMAARASMNTNCVTTTGAENYWKYAPERHPFISYRAMVFNTLEEYTRTGEYYLGEFSKEEDLIGKRVSDGALSLVRLKEPDFVLESLRKRQISLAGGINTIVLARLDQIFRPETHQNITNYGDLSLQQASNLRLDLSGLAGEAITRELRPPKLAHRIEGEINDLAEKLEAYLSSDPGIVVTDLSDILYETSTKVKKKGETVTEVKLRPKFNVGFAALQVDANYQAEDGIKAVPVTLTLGIDMLDRNALKRLESMAPKVSLISWLESPNVFRYATVVECGEDKGIWAGVYSNLRIVSPPNT